MSRRTSLLMPARALVFVFWQVWAIPQSIITKQEKCNSDAMHAREHLIAVVYLGVLVPMLFKLYIGKSNPVYKLSDSEMERVFKGFQEIYKEYGVKVIGAWENSEDPLESYLITAYNDATHYKETVAKMQANETYQKLTEERKASRETVKVVTLKTLPGSPIE